MLTLSIYPMRGPLFAASFLHAPHDLYALATPLTTLRTPTSDRFPVGLLVVLHCRRTVGPGSCTAAVHVLRTLPVRLCHLFVSTRTTTNQDHTVLSSSARLQPRSRSPMTRHRGVSLLATFRGPATKYLISPSVSTLHEDYRCKKVRLVAPIAAAHSRTSQKISLIEIQRKRPRRPS